MACTPLIAALRDQGHEVSALLTTRNAGIFARIAFFNRHVVERIPWPKHGYTPQSWQPARDAARSFRYDIALIASEEPQAYSFARSAGIPVRIGFHNGRQKPFKSWWARRQLTRSVYRAATLEQQPLHECATLFELGAGLHSESYPSAALARLRPLILDREVGRNAPKVLQLTVKWLAGERSLHAVSHWLADIQCDSGWQIVAAESERGALAPLIELTGASVQFFQHVDDWKSTLAAARILVTPDTGAAHLAGMIGTPVVDLFESTNFERYAMRWRPWAAESRLLAFPDKADLHFGERIKVACDDLIVNTA